MDLNTLQTIKNILDICSQRGAFKGEEMLHVGSVYQKLVEEIESRNKIESDDDESTEK